jgi:hypothetical protein
LASIGLFLNENERKLASLKDIHKGERCFIIGNGPSLNNLDLTPLKEEYTFGVNAIYLNYEKMQFHPTYYVVEDNLVAEDRKEEINAYHEPQIKFFGNYFRNTLKADDKTIFINLLRNYADKKTFPYFSENVVRKLGVGGSVTYVCLQLAYHMGFKDVYMIGFDHNYKIPDTALITNKRETGFDITSTEDDVNHFSKEYFGKGYRWHDPNVERMEVGFRKANEFYNANGRKIYNATLGGKLEAFDRINYDSLFK